MPSPTMGGSGSKRGWYWLLLVPLVFLLVPQLYNHQNPEIGGIPFFYWYQLAWVPLSVLITWFVYRKTRDQR